MTGEITWTETRLLDVLLTPEEIQERIKQLDDLGRDASVMQADHAVACKAMMAEEAALNNRALYLAGIVASRSEKRSVRVEGRYSTMLGLVEVVRTDTGEMIETRQPTPEDRARASQPGA